MLFWLNAGAVVKDIGFGLKNCFNVFLYAVINFITDVLFFIRGVLFSVLCLLYKIGVIAFVCSFYFWYRCYIDYVSGVSFDKMDNLQYALLLFFIPLGIAILKRIVEIK